MRTNLLKKKMLLVLFASFCFGHIATAAVLKTINVSTAGDLGTLLTSGELATVTDLTITGDINAADFATMRDNMPMLENLDISGATLASNQIPNEAFAKDLGSDNWAGHANLKSVIFPASLSTIGNHAFRGCTSLAEVEFPDLSTTSNFTIIGEHAFRGTASLESCALPSSITEIKHNAFNSSGIKSLNLSGTQITTLSGSMFEFAKSLTSVLLPNTLKKIEQNIFYDDINISSLSTFDIPASVTEIHKDAFQNAKQLASISVGDGNTHYFSPDNAALYEKAETGIMLFYAPKSEVKYVVVPEGIKEIDGRFRHVSAIERIDLPSTISTVCGAAFQNTDALEILAFKSATPPSNFDVGEALHAKNDLILYVPVGTIDAYYAVFNSKISNKTTQYKEAYTVTVTGGTASSTFDIPGTIIDITADAPDAGEEFKTWSATGVTLGSNTSATTTFTMPTNDVSITATFGTNTGINDIQGADDIIIYPNPTADFIQVKGLSESVSFNIINSLGQTVKSGLYNGSIGVNDLPAGIYFFSIAGKTKTFIKK